MAIDDYFTVPHYEYSPLPAPKEKVRGKAGKMITISEDGCIRLLTIDPPLETPATKAPVVPQKSKKKKALSGDVYNIQDLQKIRRNQRDHPKPKDVPGQLMCRLNVYDKNKAPEYDALSWVWGDNRAPKSKSVRIWSNDKPSRAKEIRITEQLEVALKSLRQKKPRVVWVDALCLDQRNGKEREREMTFMHVIYSKAKLVTVWLGKAANESDRVPTFIKTILRSNLENVDKMVKDAENVRDWKALAAFMRRDWFTRRWCVQEIALAKQAVLEFGRKHIPWQDFADVVLLLETWSEDIERLLVQHHSQKIEARRGDHIDISAPGAQGLVALLSQFFRKESGDLERLAPIETLLCALLSYDVSVPKDAVYALLQLGKDTWTRGKKDDMLPNYALTTIEVYKEFIDKVIRKSRSLDIVCIPWAPAPKDDEMDYILPSWIVPITRRAYDKRQRDDAASSFCRVNADCLVGYMGKKPYNASGPLPRKFPPHVEGMKDKRMYSSRFHSLTVKGRVIGVVSGLGGEARDGNVPLSWLDMAIKSMEVLAAKAAKAGKIVNYQDFKNEEAAVLTGSSEAIPKKRGAAGRHIPEAFWRTLVADRGPTGTGPPSWYKRLCQKMFTPTSKDPEISTEVKVHQSMTKGHMNKPALEFYRRVQAATWNKRFMITEGGRFGLVPEEAIKGDSLCLIYGCSVPVVMRRKAECWQLVGECYIHGIMNGELLEKDPGMQTEPDKKTSLDESPRFGNTIFKII